MTYPKYDFTNPELVDWNAVLITTEMMYSDILNQGDGCCKPKGVTNILDQVDGFLRDVQINTEGQPNANELRWQSSIQQAYLLLMGFFRLSANADVRPTLRYITYTNSTTSSFTFSNEEPHLAGTSGIQEFYTPRTIKITMTDDIAYKVNGVEYDNDNPYTFELSENVSVDIEASVVEPSVANFLTTGIFFPYMLMSVDGGAFVTLESSVSFLNNLVVKVQPILPQLTSDMYAFIGGLKTPLFMVQEGYSLTPSDPLIVNGGDIDFDQNLVTYPMSLISQGNITILPSGQVQFALTAFGGVGVLPITVENNIVLDMPISTSFMDVNTYQNGTLLSIRSEKPCIFKVNGTPIVLSVSNQTEYFTFASSVVITDFVLTALS